MIHDLERRLRRHEAGQLDAQETVDLFQDLVDTGLAWAMGRSYRTNACRLIEAGFVDEEAQA